MKYRGRRQALRTMTAEQERDLLVRQRDKLLALCQEREKWCPAGVAIKEIYEIFVVDPEDHWDPELSK
jgi:hypothetical protein